MYSDKFLFDKPALTFDDVLIVPMESSVLPTEADITTRLTRNITMNIPIVSAAMDTVTESQMAIAIAHQGGIGIIHRNMSIEEQVEEVIKVKRYENIIITDPITLSPDDTITKARNVMEKYGISGIPVVEKNRKLVGIVTKRDIRFHPNNGENKIKEVMTPLQRLVYAEMGISLEEAKRIMQEKRVEKLPLVDKEFRLKGLITMKDIVKIENYPKANKDKFGRLRVGAAVGVGEVAKERVKKLVEAEVDVIVVDTAHGHTKGVFEMVRYIKENFGDKVDVIGGNIATYEGARFLIEAGADAIKVGVGPGSICTTRVVTGVGVPQLTAIMEAYRAVKDSGTNIPIIADGGIKYSGDIAKAIAAGADSVMLGSLLAGTDESPGESVIYKGRKYKVYRGMGSLGALLSGRTKENEEKRYPAVVEGKEIKYVPEGVEGLVPYKGSVESVIFQLVGGLKSAMGYVGARNIEEFKQKAKFILITNAGLRESHPHNILITKEAPNYMLEDTGNV